MAEKVGIATGGHQELLVPGNAGCESFFHVLALEKLSLHRLDGPLTSEALQGLELLLLGGPRDDPRKVAMLGVDRAAYRAWFSSDVFQDFGHELSALLDAGLLTEQGERLSLTPEGMFYGDTVAGTLAWRRVQTMRAFDALAPRSTRLARSCSPTIASSTPRSGTRWAEGGEDVSLPSPAR